MSLPDFKSYTFESEQKINDQINTILKTELTSFSNTDILKLIISSIDLTSLEGSDNPTKIKTICKKVVELDHLKKLTPNVAAICVYPTFAKLVSETLKGTTVKTACVAGAFPSGQSPIHIKVQEVEWAINQGANEIDVVISRGKLLEGNYQEVFDELVAIRNSCKDVILKVIIESGELITTKNIRIASDIALYAEADFIKTSTGKINQGATLPSVFIMLNAIKDFHSKTGKKVGIKPSGGISDIATATQYLQLIQFILGNEWLNNQLFRLGASKLANNTLNELNQIELKNYF